MACKQIAVILLLGLGCVVPPPVTAPSKTEGQSQEVGVSGGEGSVLLAEGVAALGPDVAIARDQALKDALRKAVEQGVGTYLSSESRVQNFQLISDRIYAQTSGYIASYQVITEGADNTGLYRVTIRAKVKLDRIADDLAAIGILIQEQGRPRIMVLVKEVTGGVPVAEALSGPEMVETRLIARFQEKGFPVVAEAQVRQNLTNEQLKKILEGDSEAARFVGLKCGAEIVIAGTMERSAERKRLPYGLTETDCYQVRLSCRAISVQSAEVLGASVVTRELPFSAEPALAQAVDSVAAELQAKIIAGWTRRKNITQIYAANADYAKTERLKAEILGKVRGVLSVITRELVGTDAVLEVVSETTSQEVYQQLSSDKLGIRFTITGCAGNRIDIQFGE